MHVKRWETVSIKKLMMLGDKNTTDFERHAVGVNPDAQRVTYTCPGCEREFTTIWVFPDLPMVYDCDHCGAWITFTPAELR